eukprot:gene13118-3656_t
MLPSIPPPRPAFSSLVGGALKASQSNSKGRGLPPPVVAGVVGVAGNKADPALAKEVRQKLIKLESVMFGNELTEGVLHLEVLPQRVLALCEDMGVQPKGSTNTMSLAHMSSLLDEALCEDLGVQPQGSTETMSLAHMSSLLD